PTYVLYETLAHAQGAKIVSFDFDRKFTLPKQLFNCGAKIVFVASPNSPSGTVYSAQQMRELAASLKDGVLVIDEAYAQFADSHNLNLAKELDNVVELRTFSKSHSLVRSQLVLLFPSDKIVEARWKG